MLSCAAVVALLVLALQVSAQGTVLDATQQSLVTLRHNQLRGAFGAPQIGYSDILADKARRRAETVAQLCRMEHEDLQQLPDSEPALQCTRGCETKDGVGENLAVHSETDPTTIVDTMFEWIKEVTNVTGAAGEGGPEVGHATQMLWHQSREVGCAIAINAACPKWHGFLSCIYACAGNVKGQAYDGSTGTATSYSAVQGDPILQSLLNGKDDPHGFSGGNTSPRPSAHLDSGVGAPRTPPAPVPVQLTPPPLASPPPAPARSRSPSPPPSAPPSDQTPPRPNSPQRDALEKLKPNTFQVQQ